MAGTTKAFGDPRPLSGRMVSTRATHVPLGFVDRTRLQPIPAVYTSTSFVINASSTAPVYIWIGADLFKIEETLTYTFTAAANTILNSSGVVTTGQSAVAGAWYMYAGIGDSGEALLYPSQTAPNESSLNHPGTSKVRDYAYVGFAQCTAATTPAFTAFVKKGYTLHTAALTVATATTWAELAYTGAKALPAHGALGCQVSGHLNVGSGANSTIVVGSTSTNTIGVHKASVSGTTSQDVFHPLPPMETTANGKIYAQHTVAAGDVNITKIHDLI